MFSPRSATKTLPFLFVKFYMSHKKEHIFNSVMQKQFQSRMSKYHFPHLHVCLSASVCIGCHVSGNMQTSGYSQFNSHVTDQVPHIYCAVLRGDVPLSLMTAFRKRSRGTCWFTYMVQFTRRNYCCFSFPNAYISYFTPWPNRTTLGVFLILVLGK